MTHPLGIKVLHTQTSQGEGDPLEKPELVGSSEELCPCSLLCEIEMGSCPRNNPKARVSVERAMSICFRSEMSGSAGPRKIIRTKRKNHFRQRAPGGCPSTQPQAGEQEKTKKEKKKETTTEPITWLTLEWEKATICKC